MKTTFGFGIIGCGVISEWHANAISSIPDAVLVGVTDNNPANAEKFTAKFPAKVFSSVDEMLSCDEIDVVCICTPSGIHAELAVKAANAKKHFIVEKPMAITKEQAESVISACEKNNVKGAVISQLRFTDAVKKAKSAIENGDLGDLLIGDVYMKFYRSPEYYASAGWRGTWEMDGGGALMNQGIHGIDLLQYLMGPVKSVYGICKTLARDIEVEDTAVLSLEYKNGAAGTIIGTTSVTPGYPRRIEINGTKGTIVLVEDSVAVWDIEDYQGEAPLISESKSESHNDPTAIAYDNHIFQIKDLIDAIKNDRRPLVDIYEGKKPVDIILAAYESSKTKSVRYLD